MASWEILTADCLDAMREMPEASVDAVVTDPPYGLEFMGKEWDKLQRDGTWAVQDHRGTPYHRSGPRTSWESTANRQMQDWHQAWATEALRVLKPGGHLLAFGGTRTSHRLACAIEDAGFEIRDTICWLYGSGFPKSLNIGNGRGTALKPSHEPIVVARKPLSGTVAQTVERFGTGALNVDGCRVEGAPWKAHRATGLASEKFFTRGEAPEIDKEPHSGGRWPANTVLSHHEDCRPVGVRRVRSNGQQTAGVKRDDAAVYVRDERVDGAHHADPDGTEQVEAWECVAGCPVAELDRQSGEGWAQARNVERHQRRPNDGRTAYGAMAGVPSKSYDEKGAGGASRFFYVAKASRRERNAGLEEFEEREWRAYDGQFREKMSDPRMDRPQERRPTKNGHPTVKPIALMRWLVRLVTPPGGTVLDPFAGSGTTGAACALEGFDSIGIERDESYCAIARARIAYWSDPKAHKTRLNEAEREQERAGKEERGEPIQLAFGEAA